MAINVATPDIDDDELDDLYPPVRGAGGVVPAGATIAPITGDPRAAMEYSQPPVSRNVSRGTSRVAAPMAQDAEGYSQPPVTRANSLDLGASGPDAARDASNGTLIAPDRASYAPPVRHGVLGKIEDFAEQSPIGQLAREMWGFPATRQLAANQRFQQDQGDYINLQKRGDLEAKNAETAQNDQARRNLEGAQANEMEANAERLRRPAATKNTGTMQEQVYSDLMTGSGGSARINPDTGKPYTSLEAAKAATTAEQASKQLNDAFHEWLDNPSKYEQFMKAAAQAKSETGAYGQWAPVLLARSMLQTAYKENPALLPVIAPVISKMLSTTGEQLSTAQVEAIAGVPVDQPLSPETGQPIGTAMPSAPTGATRSRAQFAQSAILDQIPNLTKQINGLRPQLGKFKGRLNEVLVGKVGANDPQFAALRTGLDNVATAWMRLHANSEKAREDFENMVSRSKSPDDLIATLGEIGRQAQAYANQTKGFGERGASAKRPSASGLPPGWH